VSPSASPSSRSWQSQSGPRQRRISRAFSRNLIRERMKMSEDYDFLRASKMLTIGETVNQMMRQDTSTSMAAEAHPRFPQVQRVVKTQWFQRVVVVLVLSNALFVGFSGHWNLTESIKDYDAATGVVTTNHLPAWMLVLDVAFVVAFAVEVSMRGCAQEAQFFLGDEWLWNVMDICLLIAALLEVLLIAVDVDFSFIRVLRLVRVPSHSLRVFRSVKLGMLVRTLRLILLALMKSLVPFLWALLILLLTIFMFAIVFVNGVAGHVQDLTESSGVLGEDVKVYFATMPMALLTLFMAISGGVDWFLVWKLLNRINISYGMLFVLFVLTSELAVLNIITGLFVNDALENASLDKDLLMHKTVKQNREFHKKLKFLFQKMVPVGGTAISLEEFENHLNSSEVRLMLQFMGLETCDALSLFRILDVDESGLLEIDEFVVGFMRLKGKVNMIDIHCTLHEMYRCVKATNQFLSEKLHNLEQDVADIALKIEKG